MRTFSFGWLKEGAEFATEMFLNTSPPPFRFH